MTGISFTIPEITTDRLHLRLPRASDLPAHTAFRASDKAHFLGGPHSELNSFDHLLANIGHWHFYGYGRWIAADKATDEPLGMIGIHNAPDWPEPEIGWVTYLGHQRRGIATEAAIASRNFAYDVLGWTRIVSLIDAANTASIALARKLGCVHEGVHDHARHGPLQIWRHLSPSEVT